MLAAILFLLSTILTPSLPTDAIIVTGDVTPEQRQHLTRQLKLAINWHEKLMASPIPTHNSHVRLHVNDYTAHPGRHNGSHIVLNSTYIDHPYLNEILVHEVAHYWWRQSPTWMSEGLATFLTSHALQVSFEHTRYDGCPYNIRQQWIEDDYRCAYYVGAHLWKDIYEYSPSTFYEDLRELYTYMESPTEGHSAYIVDAFADNVPPHTLGEIYNRER